MYNIAVPSSFRFWDLILFHMILTAPESPAEVAPEPPALDPTILAFEALAVGGGGGGGGKGDTMSKLRL